MNLHTTYPKIEDPPILPLYLVLPDLKHTHVDKLLNNLLDLA